jgi:ubiquinone/menaquinone biosynthesis C-methylase UbiE
VVQHADAVVAGFTRQAESFNASAPATDADLLDRIGALAAPDRRQRWLEAACGPGVIARHLAPAVSEVQGFDLTPAMVELARREAAAAGLTNATFATADVTALPVPDASFDGAVTRFSLHHIPVPGRVLRELRRVIAPRGRVIVVDPIADADREDAAFVQELERLRDPSHWATLSRSRLQDLVGEARLQLDQEQLLAMELDFDDWLDRGGAAAGQRELVEEMLRERPQGTACFRLESRGRRRILRLQVWLARLSRAD